MKTNLYPCGCAVKDNQLSMCKTHEAAEEMLKALEELISVGFPVSTSELVFTDENIPLMKRRNALMARSRSIINQRSTR